MAASTGCREHRVEAEAARGAFAGLFAETPRYGKRHGKVEHFLAQTVERGYGDGLFPEVHDGHERAHGAYVGKGAAAVEAARFGGGKAHEARKEKSERAARRPRGKAENGQGEQARVGRGQAPERKHGRNRDKPEHGRFLNDEAKTKKRRFGKGGAARTHPLPDSVSGKKADEDDGQGEQ
ncbi:hypothetical protein [Mailhella massiliensis]|uniref:hypothetical protein n=1 Tax=Mailhella massiliensis TaxID=1903261 RepID=UPI001EF69D1D|nr:hypothetical protein [Mailhella massiliensis]